VLATHEAVANALEHSEDDQPVIVRARASDEAIVVEVRDQGRWKAATLDDDERGRGLTLIAGLMHGFEIDANDRGTTLHMRYVIDSEPH
jgi:anti-sigma regulatory factor (Ser/Thr protein kinase)